MKFIPVLFVIGLGILQASGLPLNETSKAAEGTCDGKLPPFGSGGFKICANQVTGTPTTDALENLGNTLFYYQYLFGLGHCYCNEYCTPSQFVCDDSGALSFALQILLQLPVPEHPYLNEWATFFHAVGRYQVYCFCPANTSVEEGCKEVNIPQICYP